MGCRLQSSPNGHALESRDDPLKRDEVNRTASDGRPEQPLHCDALADQVPTAGLRQTSRGSDILPSMSASSGRPVEVPERAPGSVGARQSGTYAASGAQGRAEARRRLDRRPHRRSSRVPCLGRGNGAAYGAAEVRAGEGDPPPGALPREPPKDYWWPLGAPAPRADQGARGVGRLPVHMRHGAGATRPVAR
jgi:hypothetical protein